MLNTSGLVTNRARVEQSDTHVVKRTATTDAMDGRSTHFAMTVEQLTVVDVQYARAVSGGC